jgi:dTDP-4-amino-4,6-dideoxygalactose transaminase
MFNEIHKFEELIADYFGSTYAVATDSCTHSIELCLRYTSIKNTSCPKNTYVSIPMTFRKLNINWSWTNEKWKNYYILKNTNIIDSAVLWKKNSYIPGYFMCLSFQYKKHLSLGRGGMILTDDVNSYNDLIKLSYDGRSRNLPWAEQDINSIGYHYYMTPETASEGIKKFYMVKDNLIKTWSYKDYPDLSTLSCFKDVK